MRAVVRNIKTNEYYNYSRTSKSWIVISEATVPNIEDAYEVDYSVAGKIVAKDVVNPADWEVVPV